MLNVFDVSTRNPEREDGYVSYDINPDTMFPTTVTHIQDALTFARPDSALGRLWDKAKERDEDAWTWALAPRGDVAGEHARSERDLALEIARLWFTEMLHQATGAPIRVHILKGSGNWRLFSSAIDIWSA